MSDDFARPFLNSSFTPLSVEKDQKPTDFNSRSFLLTGGRTTTNSDVSIETIVTTATRTPQTMLERTRIVDLCAEQPQSVAEVSAHLHLPLGVVRVLVGDLLEEGTVVASRRWTPQKNDVVFIERLIDRVRAL